MVLSNYNNDHVGRKLRPTMRVPYLESYVTKLDCLREQLPFVRVGYQLLSRSLLDALSNVRVSSSTI